MAERVQLPFWPAWLFTVGVFVAVDALNLSLWLGALVNFVLIGAGYYAMHKWCGRGK